MIISNRSVTWVSPDDGCVEYNFKTHNTLKRWQNVEIELEKSSMDLDMADDGDDGVMNKKRRRKGARPESAKKKDWNWIELLQWGNSTLFGSCAAVQFCPGRRIRIIHRPLFGVLSLPRPFCRHVEQFKKETFVRLFFTATACSCLFAPVDSVCNYLFLPFSRSSVFCVFHRQMFVILSTHFLDFSTSPPLICSSLGEWNYFFEFSSRRLSHWHRSRSHRSQRIMEKVLHKFSLSTSDFLVVHQKNWKSFFLAHGVKLVK